MVITNRGKLFEIGRGVSDKKGVGNVSLTGGSVACSRRMVRIARHFPGEFPRRKKNKAFPGRGGGGGGGGLGDS